MPLLSVSRSGFQFQMPISDRAIWGIGLVTYQWALLEHTIDLWTSAATGNPLTRSQGQRASFKERATHLKDAVQAKAVEPGRSQLISLIDKASGIQAERDKVVHWLWSEDNLQRPGVMEWRNKKTRFDSWKIDYGKLRDIALKIDALNNDFMQMALENGLSPDGKTGLLSVAWQRICGTQSPSE